MPKHVPVEAKRVPLNCLVLPETLEYLKSSNGSQGTVVDMAVAALKMQQAQGRVSHRVSFNTPPPTQTMLDDTATIRATVDDVVKSHNRRTLKPPPLKPSEKRGPRPKGDKTR